MYKSHGMELLPFFNNHVTNSQCLCESSKFPSNLYIESYRSSIDQLQEVRIKVFNSQENEMASVLFFSYGEHVFSEFLT